MSTASPTRPTASPRPPASPASAAAPAAPHYRAHRDSRSSHQRIARLARRLAQGPILDVGAAQGMLGQLLAGSGLTLDAIEPRAAWAELARPWYREVFVAPVEAAPLPARTYRTVVCADVLEHTVDPLAVLRRLRAAATADALFVVSLPNVAHLAVRLLLLAGRFPPMERGILDRTHLHFYTRRTAADLLAAAGLRVERAAPTGVPLDELWPRGEGHAAYAALTRLQHLALRLAPGLCAFQWVFVARAGDG
ncbi:MAG TPA: class I SAM-dependent methyltransferase [Thermomicrobiales bacterium]|nr:class I SAM-dependent methyltransferase [Thermomicrobiales bacterium]